MNILIFGATGMIGQGVLRECLLAADVTGVLSVGRTPTGVSHPKLRELVHADGFDYSAIEAQLAGFDACFFCTGVSAAGMGEAQYTRLTYDLTLAAAQTVARLKPGAVFTYVTGAGTDSSEQGTIMWARVKGKTENALLRLPLKAYILRPGMIVPMHGARSKTPAYRIPYLVAKPILPLLLRMFPQRITTTEQMGRAMLALARQGNPKRVLEPADIIAIR